MAAMSPAASSSSSFARSPSPRYAEHPELGFLDREARVDEQDLVLPRDALGAGDERAEGAGHGSRRRDAAERVDVDVDERLDEAGCRLLQFRHAVRRRILGAYAPLQGLFLGLHAIAVGRQARGSLVHADEGDACLPLQILGHEQDFTDGGLREVSDAGSYPRLFDQFFTKDLHNRRQMLSGCLPRLSLPCGRIPCGWPSGGRPARGWRDGGRPSRGAPCSRSGGP